MKLLSESAMIDLAAVDESALDDAQRRLLPVAGEICEMDWLRNGVAKGFYKALEVRKDGEAQYRYFFHLNDQNYLNVNASVFVGKGKPDSWLWLMGADLIAARHKARGIVCMTNRRGHIEQCQRVGFKILGVTMKREIVNEA